MFFIAKRNKTYIFYMILKSDLCFVFRSADSYLDEPAVVSSSWYFMFSNIYLKNHEAKFLQEIKKKRGRGQEKGSGRERETYVFFTWPYKT